MVKYALMALAAGISVGQLAADVPWVTTLLDGSGLVLNLLMFCVGISVGFQKGLLGQLWQQRGKALVIPLCTISASLAGGWLCALVTGYPLAEGVAIAGCMGWYSLGGVTLEALSGAFYGSVAFLSNLLREIFSFFCIPVLAKYANPSACIAAAGATSEDTTLPMMMKYTSQEYVVISVLHGAICSTVVPVLISVCYALLPR